MADQYPNAEVVWCQEEPKNMGPWAYVNPRIETALSKSDSHSGSRARYGQLQLHGMVSKAGSLPRSAAMLGARPRPLWLRATRRRTCENKTSCWSMPWSRALFACDLGTMLHARDGLVSENPIISNKQNRSPLHMLRSSTLQP